MMKLACIGTFVEWTLILTQECHCYAVSQSISSEDVSAFFELVNNCANRSQSNTNISFSFHSLGHESIIDSSNLDHYCNSRRWKEFNLSNPSVNGKATPNPLDNPEVDRSVRSLYNSSVCSQNEAFKFAVWFTIGLTGVFLVAGLSANS